MREQPRDGRRWRDIAQEMDWKGDGVPVFTEWHPAAWVRAGGYEYHLSTTLGTRVEHTLMAQQAKSTLCCIADADENAFVREMLVSLLGPRPQPHYGEGESDIDGGGWYLVRRCEAGQWHPAHDRLRGTEAYGTYEDDPASYRISRRSPRRTSTSSCSPPAERGARSAG